jgi:hypothetical protein
MYNRNAQGSLPPECANACAVAHVSSAGANGETACRLLVFGGSVSDGVAVRDCARYVPVVCWALMWFAGHASAQY